MSGHDGSNSHFVNVETSSAWQMASWPEPFEPHASRVGVGMLVVLMSVLTTKIVIETAFGSRRHSSRRWSSEMSGNGTVRMVVRAGARKGVCAYSFLL